MVLGSIETNKNECQEYFLAGKGGRCLRLTTLSPSCAYHLEIWDPQPPGTLSACTMFALPLPLLLLYSHPDSKNCVVYIVTSQFYTGRERERENVCVFVCVCSGNCHVCSYQYVTYIHD
jgi:hypothetical protein